MATTYPTTVETRPTIPVVPKATDATMAELLAFHQWLIDAICALEAKAGATNSAVTTSLDYKMANARRKLTVRSESFDLDNGAGTTVDVVLMRLPFACTLQAARIVHEDATSGTVAAGNARVGTTIGGQDVVAATAYGNTQVVGATIVMTLLVTAILADQPVFVRHTGVAATQAGRAHVEVDYVVD